MEIKRAAAALTAVLAIGSAAFVYASHPARGSDHQDSPFTVSRPGADISDVYIFPSPSNPSNVELVMNVNPLIPAGMSSKYALEMDLMYQFKFAHGPVGTTAPADTAIQLIASGTGPTQKITAYLQKGSALTDPSTVGTPLGTFAFNTTAGAKLADGVTAFVGPRADPFFFDLFQFFTILPDRDYANKRTQDMLGTSTPTFNGFPDGTLSGTGGYACSNKASTNALTQVNGGFNVISIVLDVPRSLIATKSQSPIVHMWATTGRHTVINGTNEYVQAELLSRPAVKELFEYFQYHQYTNTSQPYNDTKLYDSIGYFTQEVIGRSPATAKTLQAVLYPNEIAADLSQTSKAAYLGVETGGATGGKFGGRGLTDDVVDISLGAVFGNTLSALGLIPDDGKENTCLTAEHVTSGQGGIQTQTAFPYLAVPH